MSKACCICDRPEWGSGIPLTLEAFNEPLVINVSSENCSLAGTDLKTLIQLRVCIDCRPKIQVKLMEYLRGLKNGKL